ncbi:MAG TPA: helix-turn-helix transcriptional regulator [Mycobacterium sp.]|uniref:helix-turn-helix domain-containing protein n=1 Tax=Mycobacterium sp. TaxID=1785 RepID=UPI002B7C26D5|nr:helix-turn-helix transcriptional regulator [Mycobacterium sp.]HME78927.1 helix-turn-helix transcriptional regulator [Mycobacterium sp.]
MLSGLYTPQDIDSLIASNVQRYRTAKGLSQAELATAMSHDGYHIHQQTIQKIEKGSRPLKYSEAVRICNVLGISPLHLADGGERTAANAVFMSSSDAFEKKQAALRDFADRLVPLLLHLALTLGFQRSGDERSQPDAYLLEQANFWLNYNWGKGLNVAIMEKLREDRWLSTIRPEIDAPTYREILERAIEDVKAIKPGDPAPWESNDASET